MAVTATITVRTNKQTNKQINKTKQQLSGADLGGGCRGCAPPPPEMTCGFPIQLVLCKKKTTWFISVEVEKETSATPPQKNPGSAPEANSASAND